MELALGETAEVERAKRMARLLNDEVSQDLLRSYLREVEYDLVYRAGDPEAQVAI